MHPHYRGPYHIGRVAPDHPPMRHNDGALIIMGQDADGESAPVLTVPMRAQAKRGEAWRTSDPDQEAFAAALVSLLNAAAVEPYANHPEKP